MKVVSQPTFFIAGGYGVVGVAITNLLIQEYPSSKIFLAGRNPPAFLDEFKHNKLIEYIKYDTDAKDLPTELNESDVIICSTTDPKYYLAEYAIKNNVHYFNISVADSMILPLIHLTEKYRPISSIIPISYYDAGVLLPLVRKIQEEFKLVNNIKMFGNNDDKDLLGPKSYQDHSDPEPSLIREDGLWRYSLDFEEVMLVDSVTTKSMPFPNSDTLAAVSMTGAKSVKFHVCSAPSIGSKNGLKPSMELYVDMEGIGHNGFSLKKRIIVSDPEGQAHTTAFGTVFIIKSALAMGVSGIQVLENFLDLDIMLDEMTKKGFSFIVE